MSELQPRDVTRDQGIRDSLGLLTMVASGLLILISAGGLRYSDVGFCGAGACWVLGVVAQFWGLTHYYVRPRSLTCVQCGYSLTGLPTSICPECGTDSRLEKSGPFRVSAAGRQMYGIGILLQCLPIIVMWSLHVAVRAGWL